MSVEDWLDDDDYAPLVECERCCSNTFFKNLRRDGWLSVPPSRSLSGNWDNICPNCRDQYEKELRSSSAKSDFC